MCRGDKLFRDDQRTHGTSGYPVMVLDAARVGIASVLAGALFCRSNDGPRRSPDVNQREIIGGSLMGQHDIEEIARPMRAAMVALKTKFFARGQGGWIPEFARQALARGSTKTCHGCLSRREARPGASIEARRRLAQRLLETGGS